MPKYASKIGDVYCVIIDNKSKKYVQYIINDLEQLNSSVIRAFKKKYDINEKPNLEEIIKDEVDFYAHTVINWGVKLKFWEKVGNTQEVGNTDVLFKTCKDSGRALNDKRVEISYKWQVWRVNKPKISVGKLPPEYYGAEHGTVLPAYQIVTKMKTGKYNLTYPGYNEESIMTHIPDEYDEMLKELTFKAIAKTLKRKNG